LSLRAWSDSLLAHSGLNPSDFEYLLVSLVLAALLISIVSLAPSLRDYFRPIRPTTWVAFLVLVSLHILCSSFLAPQVPWDAVHHGVKQYAQVEGGNVIPAELTNKHGMGFYVLLNLAVHYLFFDRLSVFAVVRLVSAAALVPTFLFCWSLFKRDNPALLAILLLVLHPIHMRLAATSMMMVPLEFFVAWALLFYRLSGELHRTSLFVAGTSALFLGMETRGEFLIFGPLLFILLFGVLTPEPWTALRRPAVLLTLAALGIVLIPRALGNEVLDRGLRSVAPYLDYDSRRTPLRALLWAGPAAPKSGIGTVTAWLNPAFTPYPFMIFAALGVAALWRDRRLLLFLCGWWFLLSIGYGYYYSDVRNYVRFNYMILVPPAVLSAAGMDWVLLQVRPPTRYVVTAVCAVVVVAGLWLCRDFLAVQFAFDQEFALLQKMRAILPAEARVVAFERPDEQDGTYDSWFERTRFEAPIRKVYTVDSFLTEDQRSGGGPVFYYRSPACLGGVGADRSKAVLHPSCQQLESRYHLVPLVEGPVRPASFAGWRLQGEPPTTGTIGLYRLAETDTWGAPETPKLSTRNEWLNAPVILISCAGSLLVLAFRLARGRRRLLSA
jgi:hypothetical protein